MEFAPAIRHVRGHLARFASDCTAATSIEYAMIAAGIAVVILAAVTALGGRVQMLFNSVAAIL